MPNANAEEGDAGRNEDRRGRLRNDREWDQTQDDVEARELLPAAGIGEEEVCAHPQQQHKQRRSWGVDPLDTEAGEAAGTRAGEEE
jgi:hypothetical protein